MNFDLDDDQQMLRDSIDRLFDTHAVSPDPATEWDSYRDMGLLALRDPGLAAAPLPVGHPAIVEWRALTVVLLDRIAGRVRALLDRPEMPLARILEGGTWAAGRRIAAERRPGGTPGHFAMGLARGGGRMPDAALADAAADKTARAHAEGLRQAPPLPVSEALCERILSLPMHPYLDEEQVERVAAAVIAGL